VLLQVNHNKAFIGKLPTFAFINYREANLKTTIMETNWTLITLVIVAAIILIVFLIWRNQKDKKDLMRKLNEEEDIKKPAEHDSEVDQDEN